MRERAFPGFLAPFDDGAGDLGNQRAANSWVSDSGFVELRPTPEPTTLLLSGTTGAGLGLARWYRRRACKRQHAAEGTAYCEEGSA